MSRLQGFSEQDRQNGHSKSYPTSATNPGENAGRKTWSAPRKDPFEHREEFYPNTTNNENYKKSKLELEDPMQRKPVRKSQNEELYQPSFGLSNGRTVVKSRRYMKELEEQMADQKRRKEKEDKEKETDWWEKRQPLITEFKAPHPNQVN